MSTPAVYPYRMIMASAGSGKTYTLTLQFLHILRHALAHEDPQEVERILATTFTRAAAGEITDRILETLADCGHQIMLEQPARTNALVGDFIGL